MCSVDSGLCCGDATTQAASNDAPSQHRGWRGVLSFSFEDGVRQGRVTFSCKFLRGVRAPNNHYRDPQEEKSRYLRGQMSPRVRKSLIRIHSLRGIELCQP